jgi:hypothetical protein
VTLGGPLPPEVPRGGNLANIDRLLASIQSGAAGVDLRDGVNLEATADCASANDARLLHDTLRGFIGLGRLNVPDGQRELLRFFDAIQVRYQEQQVRVTARIEPELVDQFLGLVEERRK